MTLSKTNIPNPKPSLPRYERYKDSGIEWLGQIPEHWASEKGKWLFTKMDRPVRPEDGVITAFRDGQVTLRSNRRTEGFTNAIKEHGYQGIRQGDLVINAMDAPGGAIGISDSDGKSTPVYAACVPRKKDTLIPKFYAYMLRYMAHSGFIETLAKGIRERSTDFRFNDFGALELPLPPMSEQDRIVAFLDQKTAEIDALIAKKQRQIELLDEQKAILINRAVTRGLNPIAKLKPSGIEWIGEIPEHWEVTRFKFCASALEQGWSPQCENRLAEAGSWGVVKVGCVNGGVFKPEEHKALPPALKADIRFLVNEGDFLVSRANSRELVGSAAIATDSIWRLMLCDKVYRCRISNQKFVPDLVVSLFGIKSSRIQLEIGANGASDSMQNISQDVVKNLWVPLPPLPEQVEIVARIRGLKTQTLRVKVRVESQIQSLKTLRSTLITHAVTGRIKV
jgi:type I restriction enzyme S subunit